MIGYKPGDVIRILETRFVDGESVKTGKYTIGEIIEEAPLVKTRDGKILRVFRIFCSYRGRNTSRTELFIEPASADEIKTYKSKRS